MVNKQTTGILLANTGTPSAPTPQAVSSYLAQFLSDPRIVPMNRVAWWFILHLFILPNRSRKSAAKYETIWTDKGSPLLAIQEELAHALQQSFQQDGLDHLVVANGMSYGSPSIASALEKLRIAGCKQLYVLPLYPQSAYSTTAVIQDQMQPALAKINWDVDYQLIDHYYDNPRYAQALASSIKEAGFIAGSDDRLFLSFHSEPVKDIQAGDTYPQQCEASSQQVAHALGATPQQWSLSYQCRFDKGRDWLGPFTTQTLDDLAGSQPRADRVFFVCPGFSVDCLETLYDVPSELQPHYEQACASAGRPATEGNFIYVPCLNSRQSHVELLRSVLEPYLQTAQVAVT